MQTKVNEDTKRYMILAFAIPFLFMLLSFMIHGIYPFGDRMILATDMYHQYYPFFQEFQEKLTEGSSMLFSWDIGLGTNFIGLIAYYLASPFNFLTIVVPTMLLREALAFFVLLKIGCAGLFFSIFLKNVFKKNDLSIVIFSSFYALCGFIMGYYWNNIWLDTVAILPLVVLGTIELVKEGKYKLYVISLALSILMNYYIGLFTCIFVVFCFFGTTLGLGTRVKVFFKRLGQIIIYSLMSIGITAFMTIPAFLCLQNSHTSENTFPTDITFYESLPTILTNLLAFQNPTTKEGVPNIYCGWLCVILMIVFLCSTKIKLREKIYNVGILAFLILSFNMNVLNFMWHGFHFTAMIPYRFAFLFVFVMIVMAYRAYLVLQDTHWISLVISILGGGVMIFIATLTLDTTTDEMTLLRSIIVTGILTVLYLILLCIYQRKWIRQSIFLALFMCIACVELGYSAYNGMKTVGTTDRTTYPEAYENVAPLIKQVQEEDEEPFYRMEMRKSFILNDSALYQYKGVTQFASTCNVNVTKAYLALGLPAWEAGNRYTYAETSPLTSSLLNLRYMISRDGWISNRTIWDMTASQNESNISMNTAYLPIGFMSHSDITDFSDSGNVFDNQNALFRQMTGLEEDLFTPVQYDRVEHTNIDLTDYGNGAYNYYVTGEEDGNIDWKYIIEEDNTMLYAYVSISNIEHHLVRCNGAENWYNIKCPYIIAAGEYNTGDEVSFYSNLGVGLSGNANIQVMKLNYDVFQKGYEILADEGFHVTDYSATKMEGTIHVKEDGMFYTSIINDGGWKVYVDGKQVETETLLGAFIGVSLSAGEYEIKMVYSAPGFDIGLMISLLSLALFLLSIWFVKKWKEAHPDEVHLPEAVEENLELPVENASETESETVEAETVSTESVPDEISLDEVPEDENIQASNASVPEWLRRQ